jgi:voltage-gated sodium channel
MAYWFRFFRSCWNMFDFSIVAIALIVAGQGVSVTRTTCLLIALKPANFCYK